jgi:hypothetical protein
MKHGFLFAAACVVVAGTTCATADDAAVTVPLAFPEKHIHFTLPDGFCLPTGPYEQVVDRIALTTADTILVVAFRCDAMRSGASPMEYLSLRTPAGYLSKDVGDRKSFLEFAAGQTSQHGSQRVAQKRATAGAADMDKSARAAWGASTTTNTHIDSTDTDDFGSYTEGHSDVVAGPGVVHAIQGTSTTVVEGRLVVMNYTRLSLTSAGDPKNALAFIKTETQKLVRENGL